VVRNKNNKTQQLFRKNKVIEEIDNKAAGQLSSMELYHITAAASEGHQMHRLAYRALMDNYNSLMGISNLRDSVPCNVDPATSPIFSQHNFSSDPELRENNTTLKDMRTAIHKLLPEELENATEEEDVPSITGDQGPNEDSFASHTGVAHLSFTSDAFQELLTIIQENFSMAEFEHCIDQISIYRLTDKQCAKFKTELDCHRFRFTHHQWD
jgi:hypothetical protein